MLELHELLRILLIALFLRLIDAVRHGVVVELFIDHCLLKIIRLFFELRQEQLDVLYRLRLKALLIQYRADVLSLKLEDFKLLLEGKVRVCIEPEGVRRKYLDHVERF